MSAAEKTFTPVLNEGSGNNVTYIRPSALAEEGTTGVITEGIYEGTVPNNFDETKSDYKVRLEDGTLAVLNHSGSLANQLNRVGTGTYVRISYNGKQPMKSGKMAGKLAHAFIVEVEAS
jgi:hypothetical protein